MNLAQSSKSAAGEAVRKSLLVAAIAGTVLLSGCTVLNGAVSGQGKFQAPKGKFVRLTTDGRSYTKVGMGWSPDGKHILFAKGKYADVMQLCVMDPDGKHVKVISDIGWHRHWGWSPDSKKIVFSSFTNSRDIHPGVLYLYDLASGKASVLYTGFDLFRDGSQTGWGFPAWTKDSKVFVVRMNRTNDSELQGEDLLFDIEKHQMKKLTPNNYSTGSLHAGSWSPDGKFFAMQSKDSENGVNRVWVCKRDGSDLHPITPLDWPVYGDPCWSSRGDLIAFSSNHGRLAEEIKDSACDVWLVKPDGTDLHELTHGSSTDVGRRLDFGYPEWTPDGEYISCISHRFDRYRNSFSGITIINAKTGECTPVFVNDPKSDIVFQGLDRKNSNLSTKSHIAFIGRYSKMTGRETGDPNISEGGNDVLYSYDLKARKLSKIAIGSSGIFATALFYDGWFFQPYWSPDDRKLLFEKDKDTGIPDRDREDLYLYEP